MRLQRGGLAARAQRQPRPALGAGGLRPVRGAARAPGARGSRLSVAAPPSLDALVPPPLEDEHEVSSSFCGTEGARARCL